MSTALSGIIYFQISSMLFTENTRNIDIDEDDVPTAAMRTMAIGDVRPQEQQEQDQPSSSKMVHPPTQDGEQIPQEEGQDQGGAHENK